MYETIVSGSLRTSLTWILLLSLTLIGSAADSAAQEMPNRVRMMLPRSREASSRPSQLVQTSPSVPTWSLPDPFVNDPDLFTNRESHSAVYDPGTNNMIVLGGADGNLILQNDGWWIAMRMAAAVSRPGRGPSRTSTIPSPCAYFPRRGVRSNEQPHDCFWRMCGHLLLSSPQ